MKGIYNVGDLKVNGSVSVFLIIFGRGDGNYDVLEKKNNQGIIQHSGQLGHSCGLTPAGYSLSVNPGNGAVRTTPLCPALTSQYGQLGQLCGLTPAGYLKK